MSRVSISHSKGIHSKEIRKSELYPGFGMVRNSARNFAIRSTAEFHADIVGRPVQSIFCSKLCGRNSSRIEPTEVSYARTFTWPPLCERTIRQRSKMTPARWIHSSLSHSNKRKSFVSYTITYLFFYISYDVFKH